jgi:hypothetical protein
MASIIRATSTLSGWQSNLIRQRMARILQTYRPVLAKQLKEEIDRPQFFWPGQTTRSNGQRVRSPRDIVDTGAFRDSQADFQPDPLILRYTWGGNDGPVTYAGIILRGKNARYPGRDWIRPALTAQPLGRFAVANWNRARQAVA